MTRVSSINDYEVDISGDYHALLVEHLDKPGMIATVTALIAEAKINVAEMSVARKHKGGHALMVIKTDQHVPKHVRHEIQSTRGIVVVRAIEPITYT